MKAFTKSQVNAYKLAGSFKKRINNAYNTYDNLTDPSLLINKRQFFATAGINIEDYVENAWGFGTPIEGQGVLPHKGTNNVLVIVMGEPMSPVQTVNSVERAFNGFGNRDEYPYESVRNFYLRSSYGKCDIRADVYGWFPWPITPFGWFERSDDSPCGTYGWNDCYWKQNIVSAHDAFNKWIQHYPEAVSQIDWTKYDNDHDGYIEGLFLVWNWYDQGWASGWWPQQIPISSAFGPFNVDNVTLNSCVWSWYSRLNHKEYTYDPHTDIHETGHLLGLPDLYDYSASYGPSGGVGGMDMMDFNWGDHNCWSKFLLDWIHEPRLIFPFRNAEPQTIELQPSSRHSEAVILMPNSSNIDPYNDLFMVEYRKAGVGNDPKDVVNGGGDITDGRWDFPNDGLLIWHVDSTLYTGNWYWAYDNSASNHKYLKLMEADGLDEIRYNYPADAGDFFQEGDVFDDDSTPNAWLYNPQTNLYDGGEGRCPSGVKVDQIGPSGGSSMSARFFVQRRAW